jgi:hypothetical protein
MITPKPARMSLLRIMQVLPLAASGADMIATLLKGYILQTQLSLHIGLALKLLDRLQDVLLWVFPNFLFIFAGDYLRHPGWYISTGILYLFCILPISVMTGNYLGHAGHKFSVFWCLIGYLAISVGSYCSIIYALFSN